MGVGVAVTTSFKELGLSDLGPGVGTNEGSYPLVFNAGVAGLGISGKVGVNEDWDCSMRRGDVVASWKSTSKGFKAVNSAEKKLGVMAKDGVKEVSRDSVATAIDFLRQI